MSKNKLLLSLCGFLGLVVATQMTSVQETLGIAPAYALFSAPTPTAIPLNWVQQIASAIIMAMTVLGLICVRVVEFFLSPQLYSTMLTSDGPLKELWLFSRDIMNAIFAFMLLGMAFYTIIIGNSAKIKENIAWFVLAVILVNFSWFFPRVILDFANVMTATVFTLPSKMSTTCKVLDENNQQQDCIIVTRVELLYPQTQAASCIAGGQCKCLGTDKMDTRPICWWSEPWNNSSSATASQIVTALAVNFGKILQLPLVPKFNQATATGIPANFDFPFFLGIVFSCFMAIMMIFPLLGLAAGLFLRVIILWATIAFMPFTFLGFVINKGKLGTDVFGIPVNIWKEFVTAAFLPTIVAIPIVIGFIMLMTGVKMTPPAGTPFVFNATFLGTINDYWKLLWCIAAAMVIWIGAFSALRRSTIIGGVTDRIAGVGKTLGGIVAKIPLLAPIPVPGPNGKFLTFGQARNALKNASGAMDVFANTGNKRRALEQMFQINPHQDEASHAAGNLRTNHVDNINKHLKDFAGAGTEAERKRALDQIRDILVQDGKVSREQLHKDQDVLDYLRGIEKEIGVNPQGRANLDGDGLGRMNDILNKVVANVKEVKVDAGNNSKLTFVNSAGNAQTIDFGGKHNLNDAAGRRELFEALGIGDMANTAQGIKAAKDALQQMANAQNLDAGAKAKLEQILGRVNSNTGNEKLVDTFTK